MYEKQGTGLHFFTMCLPPLFYGPVNNLEIEDEIEIMHMTMKGQVEDTHCTLSRIHFQNTYAGSSPSKKNTQTEV